MKLSVINKKMLREKLIEYLKQVPYGNRIHINKELLEQLIFEVQQDKNGRLVKFPVWTGYF